MSRQCFVAAVCNRHANSLLGMADASRRHVAARFSFASTVTDRRYKAIPFPDNFRLIPMNYRVILTALLLAPLLPGQSVPPTQPPVAEGQKIGDGESAGKPAITRKAYWEAVAVYEGKLDELKRFREFIKGGTVRAMYSAEGLAELDRVVLAKEASVKEARASLDRLGSALGIAYEPDRPYWRAAAISEGGPNGPRQVTEEEFAGMKKDIAELEEILRNLLKPEGETLWTYARNLPIPDNGLTTSYPKHRQLQLELAKLTKDGADNDDPRVISKREQFSKTQQQMAAEIVRLRDILQSHLELANSRLARATAALREAGAPAGDESPSQPDRKIPPAPNPAPAKPE
jgi:hypothetical protein